MLAEILPDRMLSIVSILFSKVHAKDITEGKGIFRATTTWLRIKEYSGTLRDSPLDVHLIL
jgi:hypothetical protein